MARTITITIEPFTTLTIPVTGTLLKTVGSTTTINIDNQSGGIITVADDEVAQSSFTVGTIPTAIVDSANNDIVLTMLLGNGIITFSDGVAINYINFISASIDEKETFGYLKHSSSIIRFNYGNSIDPDIAKPIVIPRASADVF